MKNVDPRHTRERSTEQCSAPCCLRQLSGVSIQSDVSLVSSGKQVTLQLVCWDQWGERSVRIMQIERNSHSPGNFWKTGETTQAGVVSDLNTGGGEVVNGVSDDDFK